MQLHFQVAAQKATEKSHLFHLSAAAECFVFHQAVANKKLQERKEEKERSNTAAAQNED